LGVHVANVDKSPQLRTRAQDHDLSEDAGTVGLPVAETTELCWFAKGHLPSDVETWFTRGGTTGVVEERCDTYRMDGRRDRGLKLRFRETPEIKVRQSLGEHLVLGAGLVGRLEVWRKWSPAERLVENGGDVPWVDVCKVVAKRRFSVDGDEIMLSEDVPAMTGAGCDVEVVAVTVGDVEAWTFAFAAYGPPASRQDALVAAWQALVADATCPEQFATLLDQSSSYPEWLTGLMPPSETTPDRAVAVV
jgi:hypothetical protein